MRRQRVVELHVALADAAAAAHRRRAACASPSARDAALRRARAARRTRGASRPSRAPKRAEHRPHARAAAASGSTRSASPICAQAMKPPLSTSSGFDAEERRPPQHEIGELADLDRADLVRHAVRDRRVDRVLRDVAPDAQVVVRRRARPASRPRCSRILCAVCQVRVIDLADAAHRLAVARDHADRAEVVQDVLGGDRLAADAALGERDVLGDVRVEVVADHQHVEVLVERVDRERPRRVRRAREHVRLAADADDVRRVAAAGALGVVRVDRAALERGDRVVDVARLVQRVGVDRDLHVVAARRRARQQSIAAGVVPQSSCSFRPIAPARICSTRPFGQRRVALAGEADVERQRVGRLQHQLDVPRAGRARRRVGAGRRAGAAADERRDAARERLVRPAAGR